jgi:hypothetical protein
LKARRRVSPGLSAARLRYGVIVPWPVCRSSAHGGMKVAFFDLGSVATVSCLSAKGRDVWEVDPDELKVATISIEHSSVLEPNLRSQVNSAASGIPHAPFRPHDVLDNAEVSQDFTALLTSPPPRIIDLIGGMEPALEALEAYREFAW